MYCKKLTAYTNIIIIILLLSFVLFSSCTSTRSATYFDDINNTELPIKLDSLEPVIQNNDLLSIAISSPNPQATQIFNISNTVSGGSSSLSQAGYLVSPDGFIELPMLGKIKAAGLTKKQLKETITTSIIDNQFLKDPIVVVRYLNFSVTVLGEVSRPSVINIPDEKVSLLKALGYAGDMTLFAQRNRVMLIREEEGKRIVRRLDLNSQELFTSPYYYLKSNDIVYVQPNKARVSSASNVRGWMPMIMSSISLLVVILYRIVQ